MASTSESISSFNLEEEYLKFASKIAVDDNKKDQLFSMDIAIQRLIKKKNEIKEKIQNEEDYEKFLSERKKKYEKLKNEELVLEKKLESVTKSNENIEQELKNRYSLNNIDTILKSLKFVSKKTDILNTMIKCIFLKIFSRNNFEILSYSIVSIFIFFLTSRIPKGSFERIIVESFSFLIWLYFFTVNILKLYKHDMLKKILLIEKYNGFSIEAVSFIQYCIGFLILSKTKYFNTFPLILTDILVIVFIKKYLKESRLPPIFAAIHIFYLFKINEFIVFMTIQVLLDLTIYPWIIIALILIDISYLNYKF